MSSFETEEVRERRRLLENPYAYIESLDTNPLEHGSAVSRSRRLLENQYAHLDGEGCFSGTVSTTRDTHLTPRAVAPKEPVVGATTKHKPSYDDRDIEVKVKEIHERIWREKASIWGEDVPKDPVDMLDPDIALTLLGYECYLDEGLGQHRTPSGLIEVAGLIDRASKTVRISRQFPARVRTFTAAHELGHAVLHSSGGGVHRDKALDGASLSRQKGEFEADRFATLYLMPSKLVRSRFTAMFGSAPFALTEATSFALLGRSLSQARQGCRTVRDLARLIANTERYNGKHFQSLASQFRVSVEAMAIRIEELGLVAGDA